MRYKIYDKVNKKYLDLSKYVINGYGDILCLKTNMVSLDRAWFNVVLDTGIKDCDDKTIWSNSKVLASVTINRTLIEQECNIIFKNGQYTTDNSEVNSWTSKKLKVIK